MEMRMQNYSEKEVFIYRTKWYYKLNTISLALTIISIILIVIYSLLFGEGMASDLYLNIIAMIAVLCLLPSLNVMRHFLYDYAIDVDYIYVSYFIGKKVSKYLISEIDELYVTKNVSLNKSTIMNIIFNGNKRISVISNNPIYNILIERFKDKLVAFKPKWWQLSD